MSTSGLEVVVVAVAGEGEGLCIAKFKRSVVGAERTQTKLLPWAHLTGLPPVLSGTLGSFQDNPQPGGGGCGGGAARGQEGQGEQLSLQDFFLPPHLELQACPGVQHGLGHLLFTKKNRRAG